MHNKGIIYLLGAGPGDPELITLKGKRILGLADVIFYDYLINPQVLQLAQPQAKKVYVGKKGAYRTPQKNIERAMVREAKKGKVVVRLKGGDPFLFGRGGEEALVIQKAGVPFEVVPGVSSAMAVPAYAGIPLTHRGDASSVVLVTGHGSDPQDKNGRKRKMDWKAISHIDTIVILMGMTNLKENLDQLIQAGKRPQTPAAMIRWGSYGYQQTIIGTISDLPRLVKKMKMKPPAVIIIGNVVRRRKKLMWFEKRRLFGKKVLVTRSRDQASALTEHLQSQGAFVIEFPTIEIKPPRSYQLLDRALAKLSDYDWIFFTSTNSVEAFFKRFLQKGKDLRDLSQCQIAAIGSSTANRIKEYGAWVDLIPKNYHSESLVYAIKREKIRESRILLPRAKEAKEMIPALLKKQNCHVDEVIVYENVLPKIKAQKLNSIFKKSKPDWITFTSSSTVKNFVKLLGKRNLKIFLKGVRVACIGPITRKAARDLGIKVHVMPKRSTIEELVKVLR